MWTLCYGGAGKTPVPYGITVDELSRDVYVCGEIERDTTSYYQDFFIGRFNIYGDLEDEFTIGTQFNNANDVCYDIDVGESADHYVFAVGTINDSNGFKEAFIVRTDQDLTNPIHYHWGGLGIDDVFESVKVGMWGNRVYVMGYTRSFNNQNDIDSFLMRLNHELGFVYIKMLINDVYGETLHHLVLSKTQFYQFAVGEIATGSTYYGNYGLIIRLDENGGFLRREFGHVNAGWALPAG